MEQILKAAEKLATPTKAEQVKVAAATEFILSTVNAYLKKHQIKAELTIGGSVAKGTWLPGATDIDCFLKYDYKTYKGKDLSNQTEKILTANFKNISRLHGSRDYFQLKSSNYLFEIIPVLNISKITQADNITDISPMHVDYSLKHIKKNPQLQTEIRLAKQFMKGSGVYGAESYIRGFSGHVAEILTIYFHGFKELLAIAANWKNDVLIDTNNHYKTNPLNSLNPSKLTSPLILIDPVQPERNAAAALSEEKFEKFKAACKAFLSKPSLNFFEITLQKISDLKPKGQLILLTAKPKKAKTDVAGAKLLKQFEYITKQLAINDFVILDKGWIWDNKGAATFWFDLPKEPLSIKIRRFGPPMQFEDQLKKFKQIHKNKVKIKKGISYADLKREFRTPKDFIKHLLVEQRLKNIEFYK